MTVKQRTFIFSTPPTTDIPGITALIGRLVTARGVLGNIPGGGDPLTVINHPIESVKEDLTKEVLRLSNALAVMTIGNTVTVAGALCTGNSIILTFSVEEDPLYVPID